MLTLECPQLAEKGRRLGDRTDDNFQSRHLSYCVCAKYTTGSQTTIVCVSFVQAPCFFTQKHGK